MCVSVCVCECVCVCVSVSACMFAEYMHTNIAVLTIAVMRLS